MTGEAFYNTVNMALLLLEKLAKNEFLSRTVSRLSIKFYVC